MLRLARRLCEATGAPVLGGIAVFLHGYRRTTQDIDLYADDGSELARSLEALGAEWDAVHREYVVEGIPVHIVTAQETGGAPRNVNALRGIMTVSLPDLVTFKLRSGLDRLDRAQDLADVVELVRHVPLDKRFAARLPKELRTPFKKLVDAVRQARDRS
ncbi:MAG: hypothetical protein AB1486_26750 [Planctomycetota bacterium]